MSISKASRIAAVYAAGDAAASGGLPLTPVASMEGRVVAANLLEGNRHKPDYTGVSTAVFTIPPLASVGLQENAAKAQGLKFKVNHGDTSGWYSSRRGGDKALWIQGVGGRREAIAFWAHTYWVFMRKRRSISLLWRCGLGSRQNN